jgi:hypothetical protein
MQFVLKQGDVNYVANDLNLKSNRGLVLTTTEIIDHAFRYPSFAYAQHAAELAYKDALHVLKIESVPEMVWLISETLDDDGTAFNDAVTIPSMMVHDHELAERIITELSERHQLELTTINYVTDMDQAKRVIGEFNGQEN